MNHAAADRRHVLRQMIPGTRPFPSGDQHHGDPRRFQPLPVRLPARARRARLPAPGQRPVGPRRPAAPGAGRRLHRLRRHGGQPACRASGVDHGAALVPEDRQPARRADRRRHHAHRRPQLPRHQPPHAGRRADRRQHGRHRPGLRPVPVLRRRRAERRGDGRQRRLAGRTALHPDAARHRAAFHRQPDAELRFRQAAARPRTAADLPGVQLHDPPGLRLPGAVAPPRLSAADGRVGPVGQHRQRDRAGPPRRRDRC